MAQSVQFVVMPWHSIHYPSLGVGILTGIAQRTHPEISVQTRYANLDWAEFLLRHSDGVITPHDHVKLGEDLFFQGVGEWVFSNALWGANEWRVEEFRRYFLGAQPSAEAERNFQLALRAHRLAPTFIDELAHDLLRSDPDVLALTSVFAQNVPCLALAKRVKELNPDIITIMGGGNCDGAQGPALHRNFHFLDFVVSGEGEKAFRGFLSFLSGREQIESVPGLSWRMAGATRSNLPSALTQADEMSAPEYDDYFEQMLSSDVSEFYEPSIVVESARGCWWGEKHHCTFCGLNGTGMAFRRKDADAMLEEIERLVVKHKVLDVILADNIISMDYFTSFLPKLSERGLDLRLHYEIKSNLKREQLEALRRAGVWHVQPGIESLSTRVLKLMDKGATAALNVRVLRDCEELGLTASWNVLVGFPGETEEDYRSTIEQLPLLAHLQPPNAVARLAIERFSPFFNNPALGFPERRPAECFRVIYDLPEQELNDMVYVFDAPEMGISTEMLARLQEMSDCWDNAYQGNSTLTWEKIGVGILIEEGRAGWAEGAYVIADPLYCAVFELLERPMTSRACMERVASVELRPELATIESCLFELRRRGLLFQDEDRYVRLPTKKVPYRIRPKGKDPSADELVPFEVSLA